MPSFDQKMASLLCLPLLRVSYFFFSHRSFHFFRNAIRSSSLICIHFSFPGCLCDLFHGRLELPKRKPPTRIRLSNSKPVAFQKLRGFTPVASTRISFQRYMITCPNTKRTKATRAKKKRNFTGEGGILRLDE